MVSWRVQRWCLSFHLCCLKSEVGGTISLSYGNPGLALQGQPGQMGSVLDKAPLLFFTNALLFHVKSSTVFSKCWNWQLYWSLATAEQSPIQIKQPQPNSVESCDGAHRGRPLSPPPYRGWGLCQAAPRIPEGGILQTSYTAAIIPVSQGGLMNWGRGVYLSWLPFTGATRGWVFPDLLLLPTWPSLWSSFIHARFCSTSFSE